MAAGFHINAHAPQRIVSSTTVRNFFYSALIVSSRRRASLRRVAND